MTISERRIAGGTWNEMSTKVQHALNSAARYRPTGLTVNGRIASGGTKNRITKRVKNLLRSSIWYRANADPEYQRLKARRATVASASHHRAHVDTFFNHRKGIRRYVVSVEEYRRMLDSQGGHCAICTTTPSSNRHHKTLCVDHDHNTGLVRGLLCHDHNTALGFFTTVEQLEAALTYLRKAKGI